MEPASSSRSSLLPEPVTAALLRLARPSTIVVRKSAPLLSIRSRSSVTPGAPLSLRTPARAGLLLYAGRERVVSDRSPQ